MKSFENIKKNRKTVLLISLTLLVLLSFGVLYTLLLRDEVEAGWWNETWLYRKRVPVNNPNTETTDQYLKIDLDTSSLISDGKLQSGCQDLRITNHQGNLLPFFIDGDPSYTCNTATSAIYVLVDNIPEEESTIYLYYGNPSASSGESRTGSANVPGLSCKTIGDHTPSNRGDDMYYITPTGNLADKIEVECDLTNNGGGWTKVYEGLCTSAAKTTWAYGNVTEISHEELTFDDMWVSAKYWDYSETRTTTETATMSETFSWYFEWLFSQTDGDSPNVKFYAEDDGIQDVQFTSLGVILSGYGNSWRRVLPKFYVYDGEEDYMYLGNLSGTGINYADWNDYGGGDARYNTQMNRDTPRESGLNLTPAEFQTIKTWIRADNINLDINQSVGIIGAEEVSPGPIGYWKFDEGIGVVAYDASGQGNDGTITGASWEAEDMCVSGKCLSFDGSGGEKVQSSSVRIPENGTLSVWIKGKANQQVAQNIYPFGFLNLTLLGPSTDNSDNRSGLIARKDSTNYYWSWGAQNLYDGNWHLYTVTWDDTDVYLFIDGKQIGSPKAHNGNIPIGESRNINAGSAWGSYGPHTGYLDEPKIYPYARTKDQIKSDYAAGLSGIGSTKGVSTSFGSYSPKWMSDGLVGYWKMDESSWNGTANEVIDHSGNSNHGTSVNGADTGTGKFGNGGSFDGSNDYVQIDEPFLPYQSDEFTRSVWFKWGGSGGGTDGRCFVYETYPSWTGNLFIENDGTTLSSSSRTEDSANNAVSTTIETNRWYLATTVFKRGEFNKLYLNGELVDETSVSSSHLVEIDGMNLATYRDANNRWFDGSIDEVRIYNRALSATEVKDLYEWAPGPVGYWNFDEGSGTTTIYDRSGNGKDLTMNGSMTNEDWVNGKFGNAIDLDGSNDTLTRTPSSDFNFGTGSFAFSFWSKKGAQTVVMPLSKSTHGYANPGYRFYINPSNTLYFFVGDGSNQIEVGTDISPYVGKWTHYAGVWDSITKTGRVYINGKQATSQTNVNIGSINNDYRFTLGSAGSGGYVYQGKIDDVRIYNYARTQKQILEDMGGGMPSNLSMPKPISHWKFDEGAGTEAYDSSGRGNTGTINGANWINYGRSNKALAFDGVDDYVGSNIDLRQDFTLTGWFKHDTIDQFSFFGQGTTSTNNGLHICFRSPSIIRFGMYGDDTDFTNLTTNTETWYYYTFTYSHSSPYEKKAYRNGVELSSTPVQTQTQYTGTGLFRIGATYSSGGTYGKGAIDNVKIYNKVLSPKEVLLDYNQGMTAVLSGSSPTIGNIWGGSASSEYCIPGDSVTCDPPVGEWSFDENQGTTAKDTSGNGNDGTLTNMDNSNWVKGANSSGSGLRFSDATDIVSLPNIPDPPSAFTVNLWARAIKVDDWGYIFHRGSSTTIGSSVIWIGINTDGNYAASVNGRYTQGATTLTANKTDWRYISLTYDGNTQKIYIDGQLLVSDTFGSITNSTTSNLTGIGGTPHSTTYRPIDGDVDQVHIYNYARTPAQIAWDYNKGAPVAHWRFDECQGTMVHDISGNNNDGTIYIGSTGTQTSAGTCTSKNTSDAWYNGREGKLNSSLSFDGTDDYVDIASEALITNQSYTISGWVNIGDLMSSDGIIFANSNNSGDQIIDSIGIKSGQLAWNYVGAGTYKAGSTTTFSVGQWGHFAFVSDGGRTGTTKIYINGREDTIISTGFYRTADRVQLGGRTSGNPAYFNGLIDDLRIYNYPLTEEQIKLLYNNNAAVRF